MYKVKLSEGFIIDSIITTKEKRFNECFTTKDELEFVKKCVKSRAVFNDINIEYIAFEDKDIIININDVLVKATNSSYINIISDKILRALVYDEKFIYYCLYEYKKKKLISSIEKTCDNCNTHCCGSINKTYAQNCKSWSYNEDQVNNKHNVIKKLIQINI